MTEHSREPIVTLGIDLAKRSFHLFGVDAHCEQYPHFYRFAKLMEQFAKGIAAGNFDDILGKHP